jgi:hypothetical protein
MTQLSEVQIGEAISSIHLRLLSQPIIFVTTILLVCLSIALFLMESTSEQVSAMLSEQNAASLKLWSELIYHERHHQLLDDSLPPGLRDDLVEFSRTNANIIKSAYRLTFRHLLSPGASWEDVKGYIRPVDGDNTPFDRLVVNPNIDNKTLVTEGFYHIRLYQAIREYAQDNTAMDKVYVTATSTYILPPLYALLGAFLYACRSRAHRRQEEWVEHRYTMAFILGATISVFSSQFSNVVILSPYALAFLAGYATDPLLSHLDSLVEKMKHPARDR